MSAPRPARDYTQRPQKAIKLKPSIAKEPPSPVTRRGPPREALAAETLVPTEAAMAATTPPAVSSDALTPELVAAVTRAAQRSGLAPDEWIVRASRALEEQAPRSEPRVSTEEVVLLTLREMNQRLAALEGRRGLLGWLRRRVLT